MFQETTFPRLRCLLASGRVCPTGDPGGRLNKAVKREAWACLPLCLLAAEAPPSLQLQILGVTPPPVTASPPVRGGRTVASLWLISSPVLFLSSFIIHVSNPCVALPLFERPGLVSILLAVLWLVHIIFLSENHPMLLRACSTDIQTLVSQTQDTESRETWGPWACFNLSLVLYRDRREALSSELKPIACIHRLCDFGRVA